jgi:hypothetical protein
MLHPRFNSHSSVPTCQRVVPKVEHVAIMHLHMDLALAAARDVGAHHVLLLSLREWIWQEKF